MTRFQKILRSHNKAAKHTFRNMDFSRKSEAYDVYKNEGITKRLIKSCRKGDRVPLAVPC